MLVAQSYTHQIMSAARHAKRKPSRKSEKESTRIPEKESTRKLEKELNDKQPKSHDGRPKFMSRMTSPTTSKPVVIPSRTATPKSRARPDPVPVQHDNQAIPPSMAALLAIASVHESTSIGLNPRLSEKLVQKETLSPDDFRFTLSSSSPKSWSILQGLPDEEEKGKHCEADSCSSTTESTRTPFSSCRSLSTESLPSLISELDMESPTTIDTVTPSSRGRLEHRKISLPMSLTCEADHPLSPPLQDSQEQQVSDQDKSLELELPLSQAPTARSLKSNLTASFDMLRSAARTTLASISPRDYTPNPLSSFSAPASISPVETSPMVLGNIDALPFYVTTALPELPIAPMSIQLMPYSPSTVRGSASATAPPIFFPTIPSEKPVIKQTSPRPREPRENSDFMRVVVMEMNMRRAGKLNSEGRARIWLSARKDANGGREMQIQNSRSVPARWCGVSA